VSPALPSATSVQVGDLAFLGHTVLIGPRLDPSRCGPSGESRRCLSAASLMLHLSGPGGHRL
jgi:hypothetical protein